MLSDEETVEWLKKNRADFLGGIDLSGLDFGDAHISLYKIKARTISNVEQKADKIDNEGQEAKTWIINSKQISDGDIWNERQKAERGIWNDEQRSNEFISNERQAAKKIYS